MNNQHSAAIGRDQENRLLLPIAHCQLPAFETRNWKLENRKGAVQEIRISSLHLQSSIANRQYGPW